MTILLTAEGAERDKVFQPIVFGVLVPAALYGVGLLWQRFFRKK